jgi:peptidoglycan/xylan/chitin deacetylase (PgdA/CDA1 family)
MYHSISAQPHCAGRHAYFETATAPEVFQRHCRLLREYGFEVVPLSRIPDILTSKTAAPRAAITFDDGFADVYENALPVLEHYQYPATAFLPTRFIDSPLPGLEGRRHLRWAQVRQLADAGVSIGSHTVDHVHLATLGLKEIERQVVESRKTIEDRLGCPTLQFSFPYKFPEAHPRLLRSFDSILSAAGYRVGVTTRIGRARIADQPLFHRRLPVNTHDDDRLFIAKLLGAYDWLAAPQRFTKWLRRVSGSEHFAQGLKE